MTRVLARFHKNIYYTTAITSDSKQSVLLNCYQFFLRSSTTKKQIFWLTFVMFHELLLTSFCKLPQHVMCIILRHVRNTDSHIYTSIQISNTKLWPSQVTHCFITLTSKCFITVILFIKKDVPSLAFLNCMLWCLHPYTLMAPFACTLPCTSRALHNFRSWIICNVLY
jgi:hypothetical protein